jgi:hypothetical protein
MTALTEDPLISTLVTLGLPPGQYVIAGSGPLLAHGLLKKISDLDVVAIGAAWLKATSLGTVEPAPFGPVNRVLLKNSRIEILDGWFTDKWSADELIATADVIDGLRFVRLEVVRDYKATLARKKDLKHLQLIDDYLRVNP